MFISLLDYYSDCVESVDTIYCTEIDEPKVVEKTKGKSKIRGRRTLADISNMPQGFTGLKDHKSGPSSDALSFRKHIDQLQKENAALMKRLAEKNKVIELSGTEMQKLRVTLEKVKEQNLQLAQSNNQMLEEVRSHKERGKDIAGICQADDIGVGLQTMIILLYRGDFKRKPPNS
ncbi:hypothetical protein HanRHA438_Chr08g0340921 [Helianthus annuus]|nr:hypothetical protein HanRHA438_Chr08g0340921 [Helianthus annuus]